MRHSIRSNTSRHEHQLPRMQGLVQERERDAQRARTERAVLAGVILPDSKSDPADPLGELGALAEAADVTVVDRLLQKRMKLATNTALGRGKLAELAELVRAHSADVVIVDNDLSPRQIRGIEEAAGCKVIDRSELILDIFATRARTREAQLQVELAQLQYTAPRIRGMWTHLERVAGAGGGTAAGAVGGVGTRGPGERQLEIDRRIVRDRISQLRREIEEIDERKVREVRSRHDQYTVCLVGYTNAGKSTLMNRLTQSDRFAADMLFATLDTKTVRWGLGDGAAVLLSDTVGFIRDLPHHLVASFRATLEEAIHADLLLHVVDCSARDAWQQMVAVEEVLASLNCQDTPQFVLLNKVDLAPESPIISMIAGTQRESLAVSAARGDGLEAMTAVIREKLHGRRVVVTVMVPHRDGRALSRIDEVAETNSRRYTADGVELRIHIARENLQQILGRFPSVQLVEGPPPVEDA